MALEYPMKASNINIEAARAGTTNAPASGSTSTPSTTSLFGIYAGSGVDQSAPHAYSEFLNKSFVPPVISCGTSTAAVGSGEGVGYFEAQIDFLSTTGAIVIYFFPDSVPDGISFVYNSVTYNTLTSNANGRITAASGTNNIVGSDSVGGCTESSLITNSPYQLTKSVWNGTEFGSTGNNQSNLIAAASNINLSSGGITYTLVIPKTAASPSNGTLKIIAPCSGTGWRVTLPCAITLPSFTTNSVAATSTIACCTATQNQTYYYAKNASITNPFNNFVIDTNTSNLPEVNYFVFSNSTGATALSNGYYKINSTQALYVQNGVVDSIVTCPSCTTGFQCTPIPDVSASGACADNTRTTRYFSPVVSGQTRPIVGNNVWQDAAKSTKLADGFYRYDSPNQSFQVDTSGVVVNGSIANC